MTSLQPQENEENKSSENLTITKTHQKNEIFNRWVSRADSKSDNNDKSNSNTSKIGDKESSFTAVSKNEYRDDLPDLIPQIRKEKTEKYHKKKRLGLKRSSSNPNFQSQNQIEKVSSKSLLTRKQMPRSMSQEFTNLQPNFLLQMLFELPDIATIGLGDRLREIRKRTNDFNELKFSSKHNTTKNKKSTFNTEFPNENTKNTDTLDGGNMPIPKNSIDTEKRNIINEITNNLTQNNNKIVNVNTNNTNDYEKLSDKSDDNDSQLSEKELEAQIKNLLSTTWTLNLIIAVLQAIIGAFVFGFHTSALNVTSDVIKQSGGYDGTDIVILTTVFGIGGAIGALSGGTVSDKIGRKKMFIIIDIIVILGSACFALFAKHSLALFIVARILVGIGGGAATANIPPYLGEISPPTIRGTIGTLNQVTIVTAIFISPVLGYKRILGSANAWPYLFSFCAIPCIIQLFTLFTFPESPKWLLQNNRENEAREAFKKLTNQENVDLLIILMKKHLNKESEKKKSTMGGTNTTTNDNNNTTNDSNFIVDMQKGMNNGKSDKTDNINESLGGVSTGILTDSMKSSNLLNNSIKQPLLNNRYGSVNSPETSDINREKRIIRKALIISCVLNLLQQFSGINSVFYYSSDLLDKAGVKSTFNKWIGSNVINLFNLLAVFPAVYLMDRWGRRKLIILSSGGMIGASLLLTLALYLQHTSSIWGYLCILFMVMFVVFFEFGLGPIPWLIVAEVAPSSHRGVIMSIASFINWFCNVCIALGANAIVQYAKYFPFAAILSGGIYFTYKYVPETKGKNEKEISDALAIFLVVLVFLIVGSYTQYPSDEFEEKHIHIQPQLSQDHIEAPQAQTAAVTDSAHVASGGDITVKDSAFSKAAFKLCQDFKVGGDAYDEAKCIGFLMQANSLRADNVMKSIEAIKALEGGKYTENEEINQEFKNKLGQVGKHVFDLCADKIYNVTPENKCTSLIAQFWGLENLPSALGELGIGGKKLATGAHV